MAVDPERIQRIQEALRQARLDALVCSLPANVLLLSGYWPVIGASIAVVSQEGQAAVLAPGDEIELAGSGWAQVRSFSSGSLDKITTTVDAVAGPLGRLLVEMGLNKATLGHESGATYEPASYASMHLYQNSLVQLLGRVVPKAKLHPADDLLARLKSIKTEYELSRIRQAGLIAHEAFNRGADQLEPGMTEIQIANRFTSAIREVGMTEPGVRRSGGFIHCMSGPNAAQASGAYARTRARRTRDGDLALVHCNSYVDGYWTDITRTYCLGRLDHRRETMYNAVFQARAAALATIAPGAAARDVDAAARNVLTAKGFGQAYKHPTGHGVGFAAINHNASPRLHPAGDESLLEGMVFNVEPAIYIDGYGGLRHCDMVAVTEDGHEVLTPFQTRIVEVG